jgi:hypothetical protein
MTMTLGFSVRPVNGLPTDALMSAFSALAKLGACPFLRLVVPGTFDGPEGSWQDRWTAEEAGAEKSGYFAKRILHADDKGALQWLARSEAEAIFADMKACGDYVSFPNEVAADRFEMLREISLPWPLRGKWTSQYPDKRYRLSLPGTPFDGLYFGTHQYHLLLCKGPMSGTERFEAEDVNEMARQATEFFRCAQRHKLVTDFY